MKNMRHFGAKNSAGLGTVQTTFGVPIQRQGTLHSTDDATRWASPGKHLDFTTFVTLTALPTVAKYKVPLNVLRYGLLSLLSERRQIGEKRTKPPQQLYKQHSNTKK